MHRHAFRVPVAAGLVFALVATACTDDPDPVSAPRLTVVEDTDEPVERGAAALVDPVTLPALTGSQAAGPSVPVYVGAEVTPRSWVSSSLSPITTTLPGRLRTSVLLLLMLDGLGLNLTADQNTYLCRGDVLGRVCLFHQQLSARIQILMRSSLEIGSC